MPRFVYALVSLWITLVAAQSSAPPSTQAPAPQAPAPQAPSAQAPAAPATPPAGYAGSDTCVMCHTTEEGPLKGTRAWAGEQPADARSDHGCESCHGPGQAHVDDDAEGTHPQVRRR